MSESTHPVATPDPLERLAPAFLEQIEGEDALAWVRDQNRRTEEHLSSSAAPSVSELEEEILAVLEDKSRIPMASVSGGLAYNFWTDAENPRGLWRRQPLEAYLAGSDRWEILLDVDALAREEGKSWVWHGASIVYPERDRALISLSDGGSDADETREFDLDAKKWVKGGFYRPEAKGSLSWITRDLCWLAQPDTPATTSPSGYPLQVSLLRRGEPLQEAEPIFTAQPEMMGAWAGSWRDRLGRRSMIEAMEDFYTADRYLVSADADQITRQSLELLPLPRSGETFVWNEWAVLWLREDWEHDGRAFPAGALLAFQTDELLTDPEGAHAWQIFEPDEREVLEDVKAARDALVLQVIRDVNSKVVWASPPSPDSPTTWNATDLPLPETGGSSIGRTVAVTPLAPAEENRLWMVVTGFAEPSSLWLVDPLRIGQDDYARRVRSVPPLFDAQSLQVEQHFVTSDDGTRVPYFEVRDAEAELPAPTLLYGYGGFDVSLLPSYSPALGRAWLERGGVYVVANIRGGGEYGPNWHRSALRADRHRAYEDFAAVARDLVRRGVTTRAQLGTQGGSNGGLLMGNMYTLYPDLFGAVLCQVPLLDMGRYHHLLAGHSWIAEYGNPDEPEEWEFIHTFSPLHQFTRNMDRPRLMVTTSTKDDRVHPWHARAFTYVAEEAGEDVLYFENIEGGHAGAADNRQRAHNQALAWAFLWETLGASRER